VDARPDDLAIADFLVHGGKTDADATSFAEIRALPAGHRLAVEGGEARVSRWWSLPEEAEPLVLRRPEEYGEAFFAVFSAAVRDRLAEGTTAILMSGGRDSTSVAAAARAAGAELRAHTLVADAVPADREREFSTLAARALGIPIRHHPTDGYGILDRWRELRFPEPGKGVLPAMDADLYAAAAADARVCLTGDGGDPALAESRSRLALLLEAGRWLAALRESAAYARVHGRVPRPGLRTLRRDRAGEGAWKPALPEWLREETVRELRLRARLQDHSPLPHSRHPLRPEAHARLSAPFWGHWLAQYDAGVTRLPLELRHPFLDPRVAALLLRIPPAQWYNDKGILRVAMRGRLPRRVLARPKTPFAGDVVRWRLEALGWERPEGLPPLVPGVERWVDAARVPAFAGGARPGPSESPARDFRPLEVSIWLLGLG
jgi:asparagine synthase (glutamine-hydrolysing)